MRIAAFEFLGRLLKLKTQGEKSGVSLICDIKGRVDEGHNCL
jgi:hypothetical protein